MLPKVLIGLVAAAGIGFFLFKGNLPTNLPSSSSTSQSSKTQQQVKAMTFDEVLALGGTCFTKQPFIDQTKDVEGSTKGEARVKALDKDEYDINRIAIGVEGDSLMSIWEFVGQIDSSWGNDHNIEVQTYHDLPKSYTNRIEVGKEAHTADWHGVVVYEDGKREEFDPMVRLHSKSIQFLIPLRFVSDNGVVDGITFAGLFYDKPTSTMYTDNLPVPLEKRNMKGSFTSWYCAFQ